MFFVRYSFFFFFLTESELLIGWQKFWSLRLLGKGNWKRCPSTDREPSACHSTKYCYYCSVYFYCGATAQWCLFSIFPTGSVHSIVMSCQSHNYVLTPRVKLLVFQFSAHKRIIQLFFLSHLYTIACEGGTNLQK